MQEPVSWDVRSICGEKNTLNMMNRLLKNRRPMGEYIYHDIVREDSIPAIVPKELFERVQERLAKNEKAPVHYQVYYLLTTKWKKQYRQLSQEERRLLQVIA